MGALAVPAPPAASCTLGAPRRGPNRPRVPKPTGKPSFIGGRKSSEGHVATSDTEESFDSCAHFPSMRSVCALRCSRPGSRRTEHSVATVATRPDAIVLALSDEAIDDDVRGAFTNLRGKGLRNMKQALVTIPNGCA